MDADDPIATLERGLAEWRQWALEPAEQDALLWCEQALETLRDRQVEPTTGYRSWVNTEDTVLVRLWFAGVSVGFLLQSLALAQAYDRGSRDAKELLDVIELLLRFTRAGTFDESPGEIEAWRRANALVEQSRG